MECSRSNRFAGRLLTRAKGGERCRVGGVPVFSQPSFLHKRTVGLGGSNRTAHQRECQRLCSLEWTRTAVGRQLELDAAMDLTSGQTVVSLLLRRLSARFFCGSWLAYRQVISIRPGAHAGRDNVPVFHCPESEVWRRLFSALPCALPRRGWPSVRRFDSSWCTGCAWAVKPCESDYLCSGRRRHPGRHRGWNTGNQAQKRTAKFCKFASAGGRQPSVPTPFA